MLWARGTSLFLPGIWASSKSRKKLSRHVKFCFSRCSQECQQTSRFVTLMSGRPEARPETSRRCYLYKFSRQLSCWIPSMLSVRQSANWWKMTPNRTPAINQCIPDFWAAESQHAVLSSCHIWAKAVFTLDNQQRARGQLKEEKTFSLSKIDTRKAYHFQPWAYFLFRKISTNGICYASNQNSSYLWEK